MGIKPERMVNISRVGETPIPSIQASSPWGAITLLALLGCAILAVMLLAVSAHAQSIPINQDVVWIDSPGAVKAKSHPFTKKFIAVHTVFAAADIFDIEMTQRGLHRPCGFVEGGFGGADPHPSRKEMYLTDGAIYAALFGFDTLIQWAGDGDHSSAHKAFSWIPYMAPVYGTVLHLKGGIQWYQRCG